MGLYLIRNDYLKTIQGVNLQQIINSEDAVRVAAEESAQSEAISFLRQKYDVFKELTPTEQWSRTEPYSAAQRVYLDAISYDSTAIYALNDTCLHQSDVFACIEPISTPESFTESKWKRLGAQFDIFSARLPFMEFSLSQDYKIGQQVYWKGKVYTCKQPTSLASHETIIQYEYYSNLPNKNVFPDDAVDGLNYWMPDYDYIVPAGTDILNPVYWSPTDTRDKQLVEKLVDITLYHLHSRISPRNIPELRSIRYKGMPEDQRQGNSGEIIYPIYSALGWLQGCARGEVTPNLPLLQPKSGARIRFGGKIKNNNSY